MDYLRLVIGRTGKRKRFIVLRRHIEIAGLRLRVERMCFFARGFGRCALSSIRGTMDVDGVGSKRIKDDSFC